MPKNKLPDEVIKQWPEVFKDVEIKAVPIEYIHNIHVYFHDGKVWQIDMAKQTRQDGGDVRALSRRAGKPRHHDL